MRPSTYRRARSGRPAPAITLPPPHNSLARKEYPAAIGRNRPVAGRRVEQQFLARTFGHVNAEQPLRMDERVVACALNEKRFAVGEPLLDRTSLGMKRDLRRESARNVADVDLPRAGAIAGKGDAGAVGRKMGLVIVAGVRAPRPRYAATGRDEPNVAAPDKSQRGAIGRQGGRRRQTNGFFRRRLAGSQR